MFDILTFTFVSCTHAYINHVKHGIKYFVLKMCISPLLLFGIQFTAPNTSILERIKSISCFKIDVLTTWMWCWMLCLVLPISIWCRLYSLYNSRFLTQHVAMFCLLVIICTSGCLYLMHAQHPPLLVRATLSSEICEGPAFESLSLWLAWLCH